MALVTRFDTPASLLDLPAGSPFYDNWHAFIAGRLNASTPGSPGGEFYDASETNVAVAAQHRITWMAFPRALLVYGHRDDRQIAFTLGENRDVQEEYCEWHVERNGAGKIRKVSFVTETPEYFEHLWAVDPARVVALYRTLVSPAVVQADLAGPGGSYNRRNHWNHADGIVHLIQTINTLSAALGLSQGSVNSGGARDNYEHSPGPRTSVDPRVAMDISALARRGLSITLREPIGLYITHWDDTGWARPDGSPVGDYWRVVRGSPGMVLRLEYEVPASEGFVVGDIRIGGRQVEFGGQLAEHVTVMVAGIAGGRIR
ncbi:hypothetical protein QTH97_29250 [Variovorax sp. J22R24]|uniref:hypothetical protein n=1 Tax=Variovorax gracilis TaxID=3053502 RepID=UPI002578F22F|nr:hypothetical protein [Variovorax sp. J22R24]MDM0109060.1 hypothetical protein [Variovorax sp. J22R24]